MTKFWKELYTGKYDTKHADTIYSFKIKNKYEKR